MHSLLAREPVRVYVYAVLGVVVAGLVLFGLVDDQAAGFILAAAAVVLGVPAVEKTRSVVYSPATMGDHMLNHTGV